MKKLFLHLLILIGISCSCNNDKALKSETITGTWASAIETNPGLFEYLEIIVSDTHISFYAEENLIEQSKYILRGNQIEYNNKKIHLDLNSDGSLIFTEEDAGSITLLKISPHTSRNNNRDSFYLRKYYFMVNQGIMDVSDALERLCAEAPGIVFLEEMEVEIK